MKNPIEPFLRSMNVELPVFDLMDDYLDYILALISPMSDDITEEDIYLLKRWLEISEDDDAHETRLHIFKEGGNYLIATDGDITTGGWEHLDGSNSIILDHSGEHALYDLAFLNEDYFILQKHGDQERRGNNKYYVFGHEPVVSGLEWRDNMEMLFNIYRNNARWSRTVLIAAVVLGFIIAFSVI